MRMREKVIEREKEIEDFMDSIIWLDCKVGGLGCDRNYRYLIELQFQDIDFVFIKNDFLYVEMNFIFGKG